MVHSGSGGTWSEATEEIDGTDGGEEGMAGAEGICWVRAVRVVA